jgi:hypothetical protein
VSEFEVPPTRGNGQARVLLGAMGVALVVAGMVFIWIATTHWPVGILADPPGLGLIGYGVVLLFACAFYDDVHVSAGPLGIPVVKRSPPS